MRVRLTDPHGPKKWRIAPYALPYAMLLFAIFGPVHGLAAFLVGMASFAVFNLIGLVPLRQRGPREVELRCGPGYVHIERAGTRSQRIAARDIIGATTARSSSGLCLTLQHRDRDQPISIEVKSDAEADEVRHALGIGHGGFGTISWRTTGDGFARTAFVGRLLAALVAIVTIVLAAISREAAIFGALCLGQFGLVGAVLGLTALFGKGAEPTVVMGAEGLRLRTIRGWFALPYDGILDVRSEARAVVFTVPPPFGSVAVENSGTVMGGLSERDRRLLVSQVSAAGQRARGLGPQKSDVTGRVDMLRRQGESPRDWLVRLDMAGQMLSSGTHYRGNTLDVADRGDGTSRRLRIAISDDLDDASQALSFLDAEPHVRAGRGRAIHS